ncbi:FKBP-type peptidyl-prolyl cis-trans isomerase [Alloalcanivorax venustensis]|jgi:FKBP-type peptidyl-prolyl cis-trans isomerase|uniref:FKBP-type peptidyl-prolyl cis-trans isomerase n=1 Tax=Alloalcanivorax venustensis TaxID=172371 RepID=UPI00351852FA
MRNLTLGALSWVFLAGCSHTPVGTVELETNQQKASYAAGMLMGERMGNGLSANYLDEDLFLQALHDQLKGKELRLSEEEAAEASNAYQEEITARQEAEKEQAIARNAAEGRAFLEKNKQRPDVETLPSGLQYEVLQASSGGDSPGPGDAVRVHYSGTLLDGSFVESSLAYGEAVRVNLGVAMPGWQQALMRMKEGEKWRIFLPPDLAYGERGRGDEVPPQSTLIYELELVEVIDRS